MQFKIYYEGGTTYMPDGEILTDSVSPSPHSSAFSPHRTPMPKRGVLAIVQQEPNLNWVVVSDYDYYIWKDFRWRGVDLFGLLEFLRDEKLIDFGIGWKKIFHKGQWIKADIVDFFAFIEEYCPVLIGRWALSTEYDQVLQFTENDREFGMKNGYLQAERIPGRRK